ncbi:MAG: serine O-acetyltransferase [Pantoea sp. Brub]|nr:serine O-acetyltransferase [Pantoea sp. Brub]
MLFNDKIQLFWNKIRKEAFLLSNREPILSHFYYLTLLKHDSLSSAQSYILANKLASSEMSANSINEIIKGIYKQNLSIIYSAIHDIEAIHYRDPTVNQYSTPLLYFKGFHALQAYRISHWLWHNDRHELAIFLQNQISISFSVDIHPSATIGDGIMLDHATGIVIGETAVVENNVSILQSVTLGGTGKVTGDRHPKIREGVMIGAGAKILGNIEVGKGAKIGAGAVVLNSIPSYTTAAGIPARIVSQLGNNNNKPSIEINQYFNETSVFQFGDGI